MSKEVKYTNIMPVDQKWAAPLAKALDQCEKAKVELQTRLGNRIVAEIKR